MKRLFRFSFLFMALATCVMMTSFQSCGDDDDGPITNPVNPDSGNNGASETPKGTLQLMQTCSTCEGSTKCTTCNGTGKGCLTCQGKGIHCNKCGTSGECNWCYGDGKCHSCWGKGGSQCTWCMSKPGYCGKCVGTGQYGTAKCTSCDGTGRCSYCKGNYWTKCYSCNGSGNCSNCNGRKTCPACNGYPPACTTCGGDGHCAACTNADGKCAACTGTGEMKLQSLSFNESGGNEIIHTHGSAQWNVSADVEWIRFSRTSGSGDNTITVTADANNTASARNGVINFAYGNSKTTVNVSQTGEAVRLSVEPSSVFVSSNGTGESITISSNSSWTVKAADSWVTCSPSSGSGNATVTVSATPYSTGTRYSSLTITDMTGEVSHEISIAQASSREELAILKNWLEKPMGVVNVNLKTGAYNYNAVKSEVLKTFTIGYEVPGEHFVVYAKENPACSNMKYLGVPLATFTYWLTKTTKYIIYRFEIEKSQAIYDAQTCLSNAIKDFKYNLGITMEKDPAYSSDTYSYTDPDGNKYLVSVGDVKIWKGAISEEGYYLSISVLYKK